MPTDIISLAALTVLDAGPAGQIAAAAEAGWPSVGLRLMPLLDSDARVVGNGAAETEVELALEESGLAVLEIGVFPLKPQMDWPLIEAVVAFCARLDAQHLVCPVEDQDSPRAAKTLGRLCDMVMQHGMSALVEFNPYSACTNLAAAVDLVGRTGRDNAGLVVDVLHLSRSGGSPEDLDAVDPALIRLVHLCDAPPPPQGARTIDELRAESRTARLYPGEGSLWLDRLLDRLPAHAALSVEAPSAAYAHLPAAERARRALDATEALLARRKADFPTRS